MLPDGGAQGSSFSTFFGFSRAEVDRQNLLGVREDIRFEGAAVSLRLARSCRLEIATGEYVAFVDSDDTVMPDMAKSNLMLAKEQDADIVVFGYRECYCDEKGGVKKEGGVYLPEFSEPLNRRQCWENCAGINTAFATMRIYCRAYLEKYAIRFNEGRMGEDALFLAYVHNAPFNRMVFNRQACYIYDIRPGSTMTSSQPAYFDEEHERACVQIERIFRKNEPTQGAFDRMLAVRGANSAHEALKQLAFAKEKIGFRERRGMIKQFCARPRVEKSLETCRMAWIGEKWKRLAIWLMKKKYRVCHFVIMMRFRSSGKSEIR